MHNGSSGNRIINWGEPGAKEYPSDSSEHTPPLRFRIGK
jgi:hypothetical protein